MQHKLAFLKSAVRGEQGLRSKAAAGSVEVERREIHIAEARNLERRILWQRVAGRYLGSRSRVVRVEGNRWRRRGRGPVLRGFGRWSSGSHSHHGSTGFFFFQFLYALFQTIDSGEQLLNQLRLSGVLRADPRGERKQQTNGG